MTRPDGSAASGSPRGQPGMESGLPGRPKGFRLGMGMAALRPAEKPADFWRAMRRLFAYIGREQGLALVIGIILAALSTAFNVVGPFILGRATTLLFEGWLAQLQGTGSIDFPAIGRILLVALGIYVASSALRYAQAWMMVGIAMDTAYRLRRDMLAKIHRLPLRYFDRTPFGDVLSRVANDVDVIQQTLGQAMGQTAISLVSLVGTVVMMLRISGWLTLTALALLPLAVVVVRGVVRRSQQYFAQQQTYLGYVNSHVEETFGGYLVIKAFGAEAHRLQRFDQLNQTLYQATWRAQFLSGILMPLMRFTGNLGYVAVSVLGGYFVLLGRLTVGDIQAFLQYVRGFTQPIQQMANLATIYQSTAAAAERVFAFLDEPEETPDPEQPVPPPRVVRGHVVFEDVWFAYEPGRPVIKGFSAEAQPGQKIAIVGPTGAGKTTLVKLLMRFYDVDRGAIRVEGHDVRAYRRRDLRRMFAMVLQETWLFHGTIMENIRYGRPDATDEEVIAAAKAVRADHFIRTLPQGYYTVIDEESTNLSESEKQLLTIARALLANPPMLILDEATSYVDTHTEALVQRAMDDLMRGRTSFVIAHRLSTIRNANLILVLKDGDVVEQGTHEELLRRGGFYAQLYKSQFEV